MMVVWRILRVSFALASALWLSSSVASGESSRAPQVVPWSVLTAEGRRIESGLRVERQGERIHVAQRTFPPGGQPQGVELPAHLGGGFLFSVPLAADGQSATAFYRARTWTGTLEPLVRVPFPVRHVEAGFDRVYLLGVTLQVALDPNTGKLMALDPLPPLLTIEGLAFDGPLRGLVAGPLVGVLYTEDGGVTWHRVREALDVQVNLRDTDLLVRTSRGVERVGVAGQLESANLSSLQFAPLDAFLSGFRTPPTLEMRSFSGATTPSAVDPATSPEFVGAAWTALSTSGVVWGEQALALFEGRLARLGLGGDLEVSLENLDALEVGESCVGVPVESPTAKDLPLFVCQGETTRVIELDATAGRTASLRTIHRSSRRPAILARGDGAVLLEGSCGPEKRRAGVRKACLVTSRGAKSVQIPRQGPGRSLSYVVSRGAGWVIEARPATSTLVAHSLGDAKKKSRTWTFPSDSDMAEFLQDGSVLPGGSVVDGSIAVWMVRQEKFVGVHLGESEEPTFGAVQRPLKRALFDGPRAFMWGAAGFAKQSVDGGMTFEELELPYQSGDPELAVVRALNAQVTMGCSQVGCLLGRIMRLGWDREKAPRAEKPAGATLPGRSIGRFRLTCSAGDVRSAARRADDDPSFPAFWEEPAPRLEPGSEGVSVGLPNALARLYAWGPSDGSWTRHGGARISFVDPHDPARIRKSAPTKRIFESLLEAKTQLGFVERASSSASVALDMGGKDGLLVLRDGARVALLGFSDGGPIERFEGADELGLRTLVGVVLSRGSLVAAFSQSGSLRLVRLVSGRAELIGDLPLGSSGERGVELVRTRAGDLGVAMDGDEGLFVFPVSDQGELGEPVVTDPTGARPPACLSEASGFIVERELSVAPYVETSEGRLMPVTRLRGRFFVGYGQPCLESVVGYARALTTLPTGAKKSGSVPLSVLDTDADGRRVRLSCE